MSTELHEPTMISVQALGKKAHQLSEAAKAAKLAAEEEIAQFSKVLTVGLRDGGLTLGHNIADALFPHFSTLAKTPLQLHRTVSLLIGKLKRLETEGTKVVISAPYRVMGGERAIRYAGICSGKPLKITHQGTADKPQEFFSALTIPFKSYVRVDGSDGEVTLPKTPLNLELDERVGNSWSGMLSRILNYDEHEFLQGHLSKVHPSTHFLLGNELKRWLDNPESASYTLRKAKINEWFELLGHPN